MIKKELALRLAFLSGATEDNVKARTKMYLEKTSKQLAADYSRFRVTSKLSKANVDLLIAKERYNNEL